MLAVCAIVVARRLTADPMYDEWDALARSLGPRELVVPADIALAESPLGRPVRPRPFDVPSRPLTRDTLGELFGDATWEPGRGDAWATTQIFVSKTTLQIGLARFELPVPADAREAGFAGTTKRCGRKDLFVVPLALVLGWANEHWDAIAKARGKTLKTREITLVADRDVPPRILQEIAFTAGQCEVGSIMYAVTTSGRPAFVSSLGRPDRSR